MKYVPRITPEEIEENHHIFEKRQKVYREEGLDFMASRDIMLEEASPLEDGILEVGTGKGITALSLAREGYSFISIDKNPDVLKIAALNLAYEDLLGKAELYKMDGYSIEFADESFGAVMMIEALHHMDDPEGIFGEVDRVLKKKGKLILSDFNEKGRKIIEKVHSREGGAHTTSSIGRNEAREWMLANGYEISSFDQPCHWLLIGIKG